MNLRSGLPFWLAKNGLLAEFPKLSEDLYQQEVVIIGSGISGALVAHELCTAGFKCVMFDKRMMSSGSTWASTAQMNYELDSSLTDLTETYGEDFAVKVYEASLASVESLKKVMVQVAPDLDFAMKKSLYLASDHRGAKANEAEFELRRKHGFPVELLERDQLQKEYGVDRENALHHSHAAQTDAYLAAAELILYHVLRHELQVFTRTEISGLQTEKDQVALQTADGHRITARYVVYAPGYESEQFLPDKVMALHSTYALVTPPVSLDLLWKDTCQIWESARPYFYLRTTADNRIMMGGGDIKFKNAKLRDALLERKTEALLRSFRQLFPQIPVEADFSWCGTFGETSDGLPYIGEYPGLPNVFFALGYGGNGTTYSMIAAQVIRNLMTGKTDPRQNLFGFEREKLL